MWQSMIGDGNYNPSIVKKLMNENEKELQSAQMASFFVLLAQRFVTKYNRLIVYSFRDLPFAKFLVPIILVPYSVKQLKKLKSICIAETLIRARCYAG